MRRQLTKAEAVCVRELEVWAAVVAVAMAVADLTRSGLAMAQSAKAAMAVTALAGAALAPEAMAART